MNLPGREDKVGGHPMLGRVLADGGYDCAYFGKWHIASPAGDSSQNGFRVNKGRSISKDRRFDHGEGCASHHWNQKQVLYENAANVPFLVALPGRAGPGRVDRETLVNSGIDLMPTLCDFAGVQAPAGLPGVSLRPQIEGRSVANPRREIVLETVFGHGVERLGLEGRCLRTEKWKYIVYDQGELREQLFDMETDRGETRNLAVGAEHAEILRHCRERLASLGKATADGFPFVVAEA